MKTRTCVGVAAAVWVLSLAMTASARAGRGPAVEIPFTLEGGYVVVDAELVPGHKLPFIFDSGFSDANLVSAEAAKGLGLQPTGEADVQDVTGEGDAAALTKVASVRIGGATLVNQTFAIARAPSQKTADGTPIAGLIGAPLMQASVVCIDYSRRVMQRWARADFDDAGLSSIPLTLNHGLPTIGIRIDGRHATVVADSGNNSGVEMFQAFAEANELRKRYPDLKVRHGMGGGGQVFEILLGTADAVEVGPRTLLRKMPLLVVPQAMDPAWGIDGLAGFDFLSRLDPCFDRDGHRLLWSAKRPEHI